MVTLHLFLSLYSVELNTDWNKALSVELKALPSVDQVMIVEKDESCSIDVSMSYRMEKLSFSRIESVVSKNAVITTIIIHFPFKSGIENPYGTSAVSQPVAEKLKNINGVLNGVISQRGELKVALDPKIYDKQTLIDQLLIVFHEERL